MTRGEAEKHKDVILAFINGEEIECCFEKTGEWYDVQEPLFYENKKYRVKPKEEIIPMDFSDAERLIGKVIRVRQDSNHLLITGCEYACVTAGGYSFDYDHILKHCEFLDGSPIGKLAK